MALPLIRSALLSQFPGLVHGMTTAQSSDLTRHDRFSTRVFSDTAPSSLTEECLMLLDAVDWPHDEVAAMEQVHGDRITYVEGPGVQPETDGVWTDRANLLLAVRTADCAPILMYAPRSGAMAAVHAGWKGTAEGIVATAAQAILETADLQPEDLFVWIGPSARSCCYTIGTDLVPRFPESALVHAPDGTTRLDLAAANAAQLRDLEIPVRNIDIEPLCTICHPGLLHSHRRDGELAGRMVAVIGLLEQD